MSEPGTGSGGGRSGCALVLGVLLIASGVLFLAQNLFDYPLLPLLRRGVVLFADYWPLVLVFWGGFKIFQRFTRPSRARVGALEIVLLVFVVLVGLGLSTARRILEEASGQKLEDLVGLSAVSLVGAPEHRFSGEGRYDLAGTNALRITSPGGNVKVQGGDAPGVEVRYTKRVHHVAETEAARIADQVKVDFDSSGPVARISVVLPEGKTPIECDFDIRLPRGTSVAIEDRRGQVSVFDVSGPVVIETAHAGIEAGNLTGGLKATTRHGEIRASGITGTVELVNRSGGIFAEDIDGDLRAETSHGRLVAEDVTGRVVLENSHARVQASRVGGEIQVNAQNAEVAVESAGASVRVNNSNGSIFVRDIGGSLTIEATNTAIQARDVTGDVTLDNRDETVTLVGIRGAARVRSPLSEVTVEDIDGPLEIENSHDAVAVTGFGSSLSVRSTHAELKVSTARLAGNVSLKTTYGDVALRVPEKASMKVEARTQDGELRSSFPGLTLGEGKSEGAARLWTGAVDGSTHAVTIETRYGDIRLEPETS